MSCVCFLRVSGLLKAFASTTQRVEYFRCRTEDVLLSNKGVLRVLRLLFLRAIFAAARKENEKTAEMLYSFWVDTTPARHSVAN